MVGAVAADVEVAPAPGARIAEPDPLAGAKLDDRRTGEAAHRTSLHERDRVRKRRAVQSCRRAADSAAVQDSDRPLPLYSRLIDDPACGEAIDDFVVGVAERVDHLQDADSKGELDELARLAGELAMDARAVGFDLLADVAAAVQAACVEGSTKPAHDGVVAVTELAYRIRLGHRGAMA